MKNKHALFILFATATALLFLFLMTTRISNVNNTDSVHLNYIAEGEEMSEPVLNENKAHSRIPTNTQILASDIVDMKGAEIPDKGKAKEQLDKDRIPDYEPQPVAPALLSMIEVCIVQSYIKYGELPESDNAVLSRFLLGDNPENIVFIKDEGNHINDAQQLVDPWGTPLFFEYLGTEPDFVVVRSAGPNRILNDSDDITKITSLSNLSSR